MKNQHTWLDRQQGVRVSWICLDHLLGQLILLGGTSMANWNETDLKKHLYTHKDDKNVLNNLDINMGVVASNDAMKWSL